MILFCGYLKSLIRLCRYLRASNPFMRCSLMKSLLQRDAVDINYTQHPNPLPRYFFCHREEKTDRTPTKSNCILRTLQLIIISEKNRTLCSFCFHSFLTVTLHSSNLHYKIRMTGREKTIRRINIMRSQVRAFAVFFFSSCDSPSVRRDCH